MSSHHSYPVESTGSIGSQDIWQLSRIIEMDHVWRESQTGWKSEQVNWRLRPAKCLADSLPSRCTLRFAQTFSNFCTVSTYSQTFVQCLNGGLPNYFPVSAWLSHDAGIVSALCWTLSTLHIFLVGVVCWVSSVQLFDCNILQSVFIASTGRVIRGVGEPRAPLSICSQLDTLILKYSQYSIQNTQILSILQILKSWVCSVHCF